MKWIDINEAQPHEDMEVLGVRVRRGKRYDGKPYIHLDYFIGSYDKTMMEDGGCNFCVDGLGYRQIHYWTLIEPPSLTLVMNVDEKEGEE